MLAALSKAYPQAVTGCVCQVELGAEITLGGLDRLVAQRELDLLERRMAGAGELRERAAEIVGCQVPAAWASIRCDPKRGDQLRAVRGVGRGCLSRCLECSELDPADEL